MASSSFEKSVKGATKIKLAPPKSKYIEHILIATHAGEAGVAEIFRALQNRLRDSTWTIVFKSLIVVHLMIREGEPEVTLKYLAHSPSRKLAINNFTEVQTQGRNIRAYSEYLLQRAQSFGNTKVDFVRSGEGRLKRITVDKGLLRETEQVQLQIKALLHCDFLTNEPENEITLTSFRLLTMDLLVLFHVMNEGAINILEHYFEMSKPDAERGLKIYRQFCKQTDHVVQYLSIARHYEHATRLEIPKIKHAPITLLKSLEEYLNDPDFEINRRQYLATQEAKKGAKSNGASKPFGDLKSGSSIAPKFPSPKASTTEPVKSEAKGPAPDLIDFFESIEQNQQPMAQQSSQYAPQQGLAVQPTGFMPEQQGFQAQQPYGNGNFAQQSNPFGQQQLQPLQTNFTGAGFGGYTPQSQQPFSPQSTSLQSIPQNGIPNFQQQQTPGSLFSPQSGEQITPQYTNPFRQSMFPQATGASSSPFSSPPPANPLNRQSTNPFAKNNNTSSPPMSNSPFASMPGQQQPPTQQLQPTPTNPFARNPSPAQLQQNGGGGGTGFLAPNATGSTNPFRQSQFVNQQTGQGWQSGPQGTMGGLEGLETIPVFPRPGQQ